MCRKGRISRATIRGIRLIGLASDAGRTRATYIDVEAAVRIDVLPDEWRYPSQIDRGQPLLPVPVRSVRRFSTFWSMSVLM
jgi:hypothetical protein